MEFLGFLVWGVREGLNASFRRFLAVLGRFDYNVVIFVSESDNLNKSNDIYYEANFDNNLHF